MRKLLLASVAALGASMGVVSYANAQVVDDTDGQTYPTPGQVTVRLNGRVRFYAYMADDGAGRSQSYATGGSTSAAGGNTSGTLTQGINKLNNYGFEQYLRLYPGFDGVAANGLKYGASAEVRQDNTFGAGGGIDGSTTGNDRTRGILYLRRTWGYLGTDRLGTLRLGAADSPTSLYMTGTFENFDDGGLNGDLPGLLPNGGLINWAFNDVGNIYSTNKAVYLSPQFYGFDFGLSYEPSTAGIGNDNGVGCSGPGGFGGANITTSGPGAASPGCDALAATSTGDYTRRANTYEILGRYRGTFGPFGIATTAAYVGSGRVHDDGIPGSTTNPKHIKLEDLSYGDFGLAVTYGGLTIGGHDEVGRYNILSGSGGGGLLTHGQPNSNAFIVGASYTIGPVIFGAHYLDEWYEGTNTTVATNENAVGAATAIPTGGVVGSRRHDQGVGAGATYSLAPGVALYASYIWERARQNGYNLITGASTVGTATNVNNVVNQSVWALGTSFAW
jgi:hypothetical protein